MDDACLAVLLASYCDTDAARRGSHRQAVRDHAILLPSSPPGLWCSLGARPCRQMCKASRPPRSASCEYTMQASSKYRNHGKRAHARDARTHRGSERATPGHAHVATVAAVLLLSCGMCFFALAAPPVSRLAPPHRPPHSDMTCCNGRYLGNPTHHGPSDAMWDDYCPGLAPAALPAPVPSCHHRRVHQKEFRDVLWSSTVISAYLCQQRQQHGQSAHRLLSPPQRNLYL